MTRDAFLAWLRPRLDLARKRLLSIRQRCRVPADLHMKLQRGLQMDLNDIWRQVVKNVRIGDRHDLRLNIQDWPRVLRWVVLDTVFMLVSAVASILLCSEPTNSLRMQSEEMNSMKARYLQVLTQSRMKVSYEEQIVQIESQFGEMLDMIPASLEAVQLLQQVGRAAQASGLKLQWFKPAPEIQEDAYVVLPVDIRLLGSYHAVGRFLEEISHMKHLITVDVMLEAVDSAPGQLVLATRIKGYRGDVEHGMQSGVTGKGVGNAAR